MAGQEDFRVSSSSLRQFCPLPLLLLQCLRQSRAESQGQKCKGEGRVYLHLPAKWLVGRKLL